jgi:hypothetical protein
LRPPDHGFERQIGLARSFLEGRQIFGVLGQRELDKKMSRAYNAVREVATEFDIDMRTAAFVLAIRRVGKAALARIHLKTELPF